MSDLLRVTVANGIAEVMLNRPVRKNALSLVMFDEIVAAAERLRGEPGLRAVIPDMGISQCLPKLVRADVAKELMMTARMVSGEKAAALGLVTRIEADPMAAARALAEEIAERSPEAVAGVKRLVEETWVLGPGEGLKIEAEIQAPIIGGANQIEAVMANFQKRAPKYR